MFYVCKTFFKLKKALRARKLEKVTAVGKNIESTMEIIYVSAYRPHVEVTNVILVHLQKSEYCDFLHQLFNH